MDKCQIIISNYLKIFFKNDVWQRIICSSGNQPLPAHAFDELGEKEQREEQVIVGRFKAQLRQRSQKTLRGRAEFPDRDEFLTSESERGDGDVTSESESERPSSELIDADLSELSEAEGR